MDICPSCYGDSVTVKVLTFILPKIFQLEHDMKHERGFPIVKTQRNQNLNIFGKKKIIIKII